MPDDHLARFRNAIRQEFDAGSPRFADTFLSALAEDYESGWVLVGNSRSEEPRVLVRTFSTDRGKVYDVAIRIATAMHGLSSTFDGFPVNKARPAQLRWLRANGFEVRRATLMVVPAGQLRKPPV